MLLAAMVYLLPTLPPTEALARLLSIFFAIFGDINALGKRWDYRRAHQAE